ncbi:hypothetical protein [Saccharibacillus deserti]|uniref:hypothetical protein n=1 Tax=Saccharibacillus deserti TaxID=1634444 RepID=UPI0031B5DC85
MESAVAFSVLIGTVILFQLMLALGMPWGSMAMGGRYPGRFPPAMRAAAVIQIAILAALALIVLSAAGLMLPQWQAFSRSAIWFVVAFSIVATLLNLITKSVWEKRIWAPVSILMLVTSVIVAIG